MGATTERPTEGHKRSEGGSGGYGRHGTTGMKRHDQDDEHDMGEGSEPWGTRIMEAQ